MARQHLASLLFLLALSPIAQAQIETPCTFQEYICGSTLLANGYVEEDLRAGFTLNPDAPIISDAQLDRVLFRCVDQIGTIVGNSFCIVGCASIGTDIDNDMCTM
ncbi:hypothetical protein SODALDRAFT_327065 [Sodiomyces alkalinus F11]|uniref:Uncharacterized protein n=1 Tax=Sodiomyces alkalinus (strain CBS 110278 / VKM F-3762 / F11) TaxID=1314773 RepID=A0A3N2Q808_SODAK|nr:hypothetical protein SODALDRAFT_327065 [Sodiomyces alkalinus F11]ROT42904.1 hypothetical protein SODALDRAFT_327065 [Sodiomyces alkalinus F11]